MFEYQYAYLVGTILLGLIVWLPVYLRRKDLRREMLFISLICAPIGPLSEYFYRHDYWRPELFNGWPAGLEDVLFGFFIGGAAAVAYEAVFSDRALVAGRYPRNMWMLAVIPVSIVWLYVSTFMLGVNSIYGSIILFLTAGTIIAYQRRDLLPRALIGGVLVAASMFIFYVAWIGVYPGIIERWWLLHNISNVLISGVPLEELMWGFSWGFVAGPMYEFMTGIRYKNKTLK